MTIASGEPFAPLRLPEHVRAAADAVALRLLERRQLLPRQRERDRPVLPLERDLPRARRLLRVRRPDEPELRNRAQRRVVLDRLMRRPVLAEPDGVVRPHPQRREPRQRRQPHRRPHVVGEDEERRAVRLHHPAVQRDPVHDRAHRVLADAERDVAAGVRRGEDAAALELRLRRLDEIRGAADHRRREVLDRVHHLGAGVARGDVLAGGEVGQRVDPAGPRLAGVHLVPVLAQLRILRRPRVELLRATPPRARCRARCGSCARSPRRGRRRSCPDPSRAPPSSRAPRPRRAARRAPSPCRPRAARRSRCGCGRRSATAAPSLPSPRRSRRAAQPGRSRRRRAARASPAPRAARPCPRR